MTKEALYQKTVDQILSFLGPDGYPLTGIGKMASISSLLHDAFPEWIFVGFYRSISKNLLEIGPYQGSVLACGIIHFGKGVCGSSAQQQKCLIVDDVHSFPGYIACDDKTKSEIVIPVVRDKKTIAVLDIDSPEEAAFDHTDQHYLEKIITVL